MTECGKEKEEEEAEAEEKEEAEATIQWHGSSLICGLAVSSFSPK